MSVHDPKMDTPDTEIESRFEALCAQDEKRAALFNELITKYRVSQESVRKFEDDLAAERGSRRSAQCQSRKLENELRAVKGAIVGSQFVVVLVDGDSISFKDHFYREGYDGGAKLGAQLRTAVLDHLQRDAGCSSGVQIITKIYACAGGVAKTLLHAGVVQRITEFDRFTEGFAITPLAEFVNVGDRKERADEKIKEVMDLFVDNPCCSKIFFAGDHDSGYASKLRHWQTNEATLQKVVLIETAQPAKDFLDLSFPKVPFKDIFRDVPLRREIISSRTADIVWPSLQPPNGPGSSEAMKLPYASVTSKPHTLHLSATAKDVDQATNPSAAERVIFFNSQQARIDGPLPNNAEAEGRLNRIVKSCQQKNKYGLCNQYHLLDACTLSSERCKYHHQPTLSGPEKTALRKRLRQTACNEGTGCMSFNCYYGHVCPNGNKCEVLGRGCKFQNGTHAPPEGLIAKFKLVEGEKDMQKL